MLLNAGVMRSFANRYMVNTARILVLAIGIVVVAINAASQPVAADWLVDQPEALTSSDIEAVTAEMHRIRRTEFVPELVASGLVEDAPVKTLLHNFGFTRQFALFAGPLVQHSINTEARQEILCGDTESAKWWCSNVPQWGVKVRYGHSTTRYTVLVPRSNMDIADDMHTATALPAFHMSIPPPAGRQGSLSFAIIEADAVLVHFSRATTVAMHLRARVDRTEVRPPPDAARPAAPQSSQPQPKATPREGLISGRTFLILLAVITLVPITGIFGLYFVLKHHGHPFIVPGLLAVFSTAWSSVVARIALAPVSGANIRVDIILGALLLALYWGCTGLYVQDALQSAQGKDKPSTSRFLAWLILIVSIGFSIPIVVAWLLIRYNLLPLES